MKQVLGIRHKVSGRVIRGEKLGQKLGFPTANLDRRQFSRLKHKPKLGVWAGWAEIGTRGQGQGVRRYKAGIVIGPLDRTGLPKLEAHLLNFFGNLYGKSLQLQLSKFLRPFQVYKNEVLLKKQIKKDILKIRLLL